MVLSKKYVIVDLHCHSTYSDGTWSVEQILEEAEHKGVEVLSITDHDNFDGSINANKAKDGRYSGVLVPGIEISTKVDGQKVHLLAYFPTFDLPEDSRLLQNLEKIKNSRVLRMKKMIENSNKLGFKVTFDEVVEEAASGIDGEKQPTEVLSRPHLARVLVKKGYVATFNEVFDKYLADGKPIHEERFTLTFHEWIEQVHELGGIMIWAHPLAYHDEDKQSVELIGEILGKSNIAGVERTYDYLGKYTISEEFERWGEQYLDKLIEKYDFLVTTGGDFHGNVGRLGEMTQKQEDWKRFKRKLYTDAS